MAADAEFVKPFPNAVQWANNLAGQEQFKKFIGDFKFPEQELAPGSIKMF